MRKELAIHENWRFFYRNGTTLEQVNIPHTWNAQDGQDGGNDYWRGKCRYEKEFFAPEYGEDQRVYLEFAGVNASAQVTLNQKSVGCHDGGYSTFRFDITSLLQEENLLEVEVDNSVNDRVYPQKADFTFYGGIYRDVRLLVVNQYHFDLDHFGGKGIAVTSRVEGADAAVEVRTWHNAPQGAQVLVTVEDREGAVVCQGEGTALSLTIPQAHLWNGIHDPYLYTCRARLFLNGEACDEVCTPFGVRSIRVDPKEGFFLNGKPYPLRGVCRHQDWKGIGNALTQEHHDADMALIREVGANTIRLAHYQHDQYFYDLCDRFGFVVWAEIPYISEHMPGGRENTVSQMTELIVQNYNHPSICVWGISNEITISTKNRKDMLENHRILNDLVHRLDPTRPTTLACYAVCPPFDPVAHRVSDLVSWNLYLGWYVPGMFLNRLWVDFFHAVYPDRCLGYSEYGCECMPGLHSSHPRRGDESEEYQCKYHEYMLKFFDARPFMWATHLWNMFDFAADARNQGGEPGMNHKGLVTFDRKTRKDSFYLYKAWWSEKPFVYLCGRRYEKRAEKVTTVKVYSNCPRVALFANGRKVAEQEGNKVFTFRVPLEGEVKLEAVAGEWKDAITIRRVSKADPSYRLQKAKKKSSNWV